MTKPVKKVLIVDDEEDWRNDLTYEFQASSQEEDCPYEFTVTSVESLLSGVEAIRKNAENSEYFDVMVFDLWMDDLSGAFSTSAGLRATEALRFSRKTLDDLPVIIVYTGHAAYQTCVQAIRGGAWDYIVKNEPASVIPPKRVVASALSRLRELDVAQELREAIDKWYPLHAAEIKVGYVGKLIALWHKPKVEVIGTGIDNFDLERNLTDWRREHKTEQPYVLTVAP
jgi:DNA-binding NtrC family response regulator